MRTYRDYTFSYKHDGINQGKPITENYILLPEDNGKNIREIIENIKSDSANICFKYLLKANDSTFVRFIRSEKSNSYREGAKFANKKILGYSYYVSLEDANSGLINDCRTEHLNNALIKFAEYARKLELTAFM